MSERIPQVVVKGMGVLTLVVLVAIPTLVQAAPPSLSANPGKHVIFPAKGQTPEQQKIDETAAYEWATKQTGWDPYQEQEKLAEQKNDAAQTAASAKGGALKGAAGGALLGVAVGAIAGDAGKGAAIGAAAGGLTGGARSHRTKQAASGAANAAVTDYKEKFLLWDRNFVAAMEGKGYTVK